MRVPLDLDRLVGSHVRDERRRLRLTQEILAERAGLSANYIAQLERGRKGASLATVARIGAVLGIPPAALMSGAGGPPSRDEELRRLAARLRGLGPAQRDLVLRLAETVTRWDRRRRMTGRG